MHTFASLRSVSLVVALLGLALFTGCSESHEGSDIDSGFVAVDSGSTTSRDSSTLPSDASAPRDGGTITPGPDSGTTMMRTDSGTTMPGDDASITMSGDDSGVITMPGDDAGTTMGVDSGTAGVTCGTVTCGSTQTCCVNFGMGGMMTSTCIGATDPCMGVAAACDGPEDCSTGEVCCASRGPSGGGRTSCTAEAMCTFGRLCHATSDCTGMDTCCAFMGASVCSPFCRP